MLSGLKLGVVGEMGVAGGGEDGEMAENFLHFEQIDPGLDQVCGVGVAKAVRGDLFFRPQSMAT